MKMSRVLSALATMNPESTWIDESRHSSVVVMPLSRRSTDSVLRAIAIDSSVHTAAAVAAASKSKSVGSQSSSSSAEIGGSTADHTAGQGSTRRRDRRQQNGINVAGPRSCSVTGCSDAAVSRRQFHVGLLYTI